MHTAGATGTDKQAGRSGEADSKAARDRLLQKISAETDLPALGSSVSRVVQLASSSDEAVRNLAHFILSDVALTQKILRMANTVCYRTASGTPVTTVSKAIFLLGFDTIKTAALAMLLVEGMASKHGRNVRAELSHALAASIVGREMARRSHYKDAEEAAVAALFKNIGRVLVAAHDHEAYDEISRMVDREGQTPALASLKVLGCSFDLLGDAVLREWDMPDTIIQALAPVPSGALKPARSRQEWLQQVAAFGTAAANLVAHVDDPGQDAASKALLARFGAALNLDEEKLSGLFATVSKETQVLVNASIPMLEPELALPPASETPAVAADPVEEGLPDELLLQDGADGDVRLHISARHASGKPLNARDLLLAGMQDVTEMMASGQCKVNDLMLLVLETLYSSLGFRFATVCLKDMQAGQFRARIAIGEGNSVRQSGFVFPVAPSRNLFHLALENDADLMISDATSPKIRDLIPDWHRALLPDTRSFIVLPLVVNKNQLGLFYADRVQPAPEGVPPDETALIKTLKGQVLTALRSR